VVFPENRREFAGRVRDGHRAERPSYAPASRAPQAICPFPRSAADDRAGVPARASTPTQAPSLEPGNPPPPMVGTPGNSGWRTGVPTRDDLQLLRRDLVGDAHDGKNMKVTRPPSLRRAPGRCPEGNVDHLVPVAFSQHRPRRDASSRRAEAVADLARLDLAIVTRLLHRIAGWAGLVTITIGSHGGVADRREVLKGSYLSLPSGGSRSPAARATRTAACSRRARIAPRPRWR